MAGISGMKYRNASSGWSSWGGLQNALIQTHNNCYVVYKIDLDTANAWGMTLSLGVNAWNYSSSDFPVGYNVTTFTAYLYTSDPTVDSPTSHPGGYMGSASGGTQNVYSYGLMVDFAFGGAVNGSSTVYVWIDADIEPTKYYNIYYYNQVWASASGDYVRAPSVTIDAPGGGGGSDPGVPDPDKPQDPTDHNWYTVTFDLDGGYGGPGTWSFQANALNIFPSEVPLKSGATYSKQIKVYAYPDDPSTVMSTQGTGYATFTMTISEGFEFVHWRLKCDNGYTTVIFPGGAFWGLTGNCVATAVWRDAGTVYTRHHDLDMSRVYPPTRPDGPYLWCDVYCYENLTGLSGGAYKDYLRSYRWASFTFTGWKDMAGDKVSGPDDVDGFVDDALPIAEFRNRIMPTWRITFDYTQDPTPITLPSAYKRSEEFRFIGFGLTRTSQSPEYYAEQTFIPQVNGEIRLYAIWSEGGIAYVCVDGVYRRARIFIVTDGVFRRYLPYISDANGHFRLCS